MEERVLGVQDPSREIEEPSLNRGYPFLGFQIRTTKREVPHVNQNELSVRNPIPTRKTEKRFISGGWHKRYTKVYMNMGKPCSDTPERRIRCEEFCKEEEDDDSNSSADRKNQIDSEFNLDTLDDMVSYNLDSRGTKENAYEDDRHETQGFNSKSLNRNILNGYFQYLIPNTSTNDENIIPDTRKEKEINPTDNEINSDSEKNVENVAISDESESIDSDAGNSGDDPTHYENGFMDSDSEFFLENVAASGENKFIHSDSDNSKEDANYESDFLGSDSEVVENIIKENDNNIPAIGSGVTEERVFNASDDQNIYSITDWNLRLGMDSIYKLFTPKSLRKNDSADVTEGKDRGDSGKRSKIVVGDWTICAQDRKQDVTLKKSNHSSDLPQIGLQRRTISCHLDGRPVHMKYDFSA